MEASGVKSEECLSPNCEQDYNTAASPLAKCSSASDDSDSTRPLASCGTAQYKPAGVLHADPTASPAEAQVVPEKAVQQAVIIVEEEPALVHTRHTQHCSAALPGHLDTTYAWSPATPDLAELIPVGTSQSQRESVITQDNEGSPCSPCGSHSGSPRAIAVSSPSRVSTLPGESAQHTTAPRHTLSLQSSAHTNSPAIESVHGTPSSSSLPWQRTAHDGDAKGESVKSLFPAETSGPVTPLHSSAPPPPPPPPSSDFHRCATAAPTQLRAPTPSQPERSPSPAVAPQSAAQEVSGAVAPTAAKPASMDLRVLVSHRSSDSPAPSVAPLCLRVAVTEAGRTNASGGTVPCVPAIRLPVGPVSPGMESDRSVSVMGYGPRSAPNACSLVSARSGRSSRSARHSHRCATSMRGALPSLKELFPTLPAEMYLARERLHVSHDGNGRLGVGAYGKVQRAELYPPDVEVPHFFTPVTDTFTNASNPNTPGFSPATAQLSLHNFTSIASAVNGADGGAGPVLAGAHGKENSNVFLHSRLESIVSTDSVSNLPVHQQPYSDQTASFYNGLDDVPGLMCAESVNDSNWAVRGQSPEVESVMLSGPLAVHTDSEEASAPATLNTKAQPGGGRKSPATSLSAERRELQTATPPTSVLSCCISQPFPDLPAVLATKVQEGEANGFSLTSPHISIAKLAVGELAADVEDNTVRMSAGDNAVRAMLTGPLRDSVASEEVELSLTSTVGTHRFTTGSPSSPRQNNKTYCHSSRTAGSNVQAAAAAAAEDEEEEEYSDRRVDNSTTLPTEMLYAGDGTVVVAGNEGTDLHRLTSRRTTTTQSIEMPRSTEYSKDVATPLTEREGGRFDAARKDTNTSAEAELCLPLVLSRARFTNTASTSLVTGESNPTCSGRRGEAAEADRIDIAAAAAATAGSGQKTLVVANRHIDVPRGKESAGAGEMDRVRDNYKARRTSSIFLPDGQEVSFLASITVPASHGSPGEVGDDTLTSTALQAVAQAVREAREEFEDAYPQHCSSQRNRSEETGAADSEESPRGAVSEPAGECKAADPTGRGMTQPASSNSAALTPTSATTPCRLPTLGHTAANNNANGDGKRVEQISPTSTVSSIFSGGMTNATTTRTSKQGSAGVLPQPYATTTNPLQFPSKSPQTPLVRYGVNSAMVAEAVNNGCAPFRPVATKVVEKSDLAENAMKLNAFHNELRMASRLNHPCLVNMFGAAEDAENFYLVMDLAEKGTLTQYQKDFGVADTRAMAPRFLADVVLALEYLRDGSQHTYWMTTPGEAAKPVNASNETAAEGECANGEDRGDRRQSDSCLGSASTLSLRPTQDASASTTPKPSTLLSASAASLQRHTEEKEEGKTTGMAATTTAESVGDGKSTQARCAKQSRENEVLMRESTVLHRDIKPDNLLLTWDFHVKLADFGDACFLGDDEANSFGGTPSYISPEVIQTSKAGPCSDLWAMGCILYELLVGEKLFTGSLREVANRIQSFAPEDLTFTTTAATPLKAADNAGDDLDCEEDNCGGADNEGGSRRSAAISEAAKDLVRQLLRHVPEERIGSAERGGFSTLKQHPFFSEIDWSTVLETTNITTTNTDYTSELADYLELGESVVYCSPVKVLPTGESHARTRSMHLGQQGSLVMVLTDTPRLFLVNPDTDTVQFWLPWSPELRVGVLRADRFTITVPINDVLISPSTPSAAFHGGASMSTNSRASITTGSNITYTFYDTARRADLWGVKIHYLQSTCPARREGETPTFSSRQSSTTQPTSTNGVPPLHWPGGSTRRATPTLSPRAGGCLLHRLRTTPRSARAGSLSNHGAVSFTDTAITTPRDGRSAAMLPTTFNAGSLPDANGHSSNVVGPAGPPAESATAPPAASTTGSKAKPITRYSQPIRLPATSFLAPGATAPVPLYAACSKPATSLTSPAGVSSGGSSTELRSPEIFSGLHSSTATMNTPYVMAPTHRRVNTMTVTIASSSHPSPPHSGPTRPFSQKNAGLDVRDIDSGVSPVDFGATMSDGWLLRCPTGVATSQEDPLLATAPSSRSNGAPSAGHSTTAMTTLAESVIEDDVCGDSLGDVALGFSCSAGDVTPRAARVSEGEDGLRASARDTPTQSEATPGPPSAHRHGDFETELASTCPAQGIGRYESDGGRGTDTPVQASSLSSATTKAPPKGKLSKVRQQYKKTQRQKTRA